MAIVKRVMVDNSNSMNMIKKVKVINQIINYAKLDKTVHNFYWNLN